ncbi:hypothetical protein E0E50_15120 [Azotobacter chroococcum subsp. isscasi]|nr:hypothetical protein E0E50_15120 [Azotobacter chroococcum subsp. isscasi]
MHESSALEQSAASGCRDHMAGRSDWRRGGNPHQLLDETTQRATRMYQLVNYSFDYRTKAHAPRLTPTGADSNHNLHLGTFPGTRPIPTIISKGISSMSCISAFSLPRCLRFQAHPR